MIRLSVGTWLILFGLLLAVISLAGMVAVVGVAGLGAGRLVALGPSLPARAALLVIGAIGTLVFVIGDAIYVLRPARSHATAERGYGSLATILACLIFAVALANIATLPYVLLLARPAAGQPLTLTPGGLVISVITLEASLLIVVAIRIVGPGVLSWRELGWKIAQPNRLIAIGVAAGVALLIASGGLEAALRAIGVQQTQAAMFSGVKGATPGQFLGVLLAGAVIAPICEETFFRGYVFTVTLSKAGRIPAYLLSAGLFALAHLNVPAFLPIFLIGLGLAYVYHRTGSLVPGAIAHGINNAVALTALYFATR